MLTQYFVTLSTKLYYVYLVILEFKKAMDVCNNINFNLDIKCNELRNKVVIEPGNSHVLRGIAWPKL